MTCLKTLFVTSALFLPMACLAACDSDEPLAERTDDTDFDNDGFSPNEGDCDDDNRTFYPGAPDPCDGIDQNCDGTPDELFDQDNDNFTTCGGDCRDNDRNSNPTAPEIIDGLDNDCDGIADNHTDQYDDDGDGYSEDQGDCNDIPTSGGEFIGPGAVEIAVTPDGEPDLIDDDCDGIVDEAVAPCPTDLEEDDPMAFAAAMDVCNEVIQASISDIVNEDSNSVSEAFGNTYVPFTGTSLAVLSTGFAWDGNDPEFATTPDPFSQNMGNSLAHPDPQPGSAACANPDGDTVNDYSEISLDLQVPANAQAFSFDFNFISTEFPEYVCSDFSNFDDTFMAYLTSEQFQGNVSFDAMGNRVSINVGFLNVCDPTLNVACGGGADLLGTGFELAAEGGGGTGWLTTTAPVTPGEKINLTFMIYDEGDSLFDSTVLVDNFRWELEAVEGPVTEGREFRRQRGEIRTQIGAHE